MGQTADLWPPSRDTLAAILAGPFVTIDIERLQSGLSPRASRLDPHHVSSLEEVVGSLPPIMVHEGSMTIIDGHHRLEAVRRSGKKDIKAVIASVSLADASTLAVVANIAHGKPLTITERRRAAERMLKQSPSRSNRSIAAVCGLAPATVACVRAACPPPVSTTTERIGTNGHKTGRCSDDAKELLTNALRDHPERSRRETARDVGVSASTVSRAARRGVPRNNLSGATPGQATFGPAGGSAPASADPALSSGPACQAFARWFDAHNIDPVTWPQYVRVIPLSRVYEIADECRRRAKAWTDMAAALEQRTKP